MLPQYCPQSPTPCSLPPPPFQMLTGNLSIRDFSQTSPPQPHCQFMVAFLAQRTTRMFSRKMIMEEFRTLDLSSREIFLLVRNSGFLRMLDQSVFQMMFFMDTHTNPGRVGFSMQSSHGGWRCQRRKRDQGRDREDREEERKKKLRKYITVCLYQAKLLYIYVCF